MQGVSSIPPADVETVDVIVPVYNQREMAEPCLDSVLRARNEIGFELVVIDDASTDEALKALLARLAQNCRITLLTNKSNLGFTRTVNRGMRLHPGRDVVLLNSDTLVFGDWIDRLRRAVQSDPCVGTANPMTNGSHISGYPFRQPDGRVRFELGDAELDMMAAEIRPIRRVQVHYTVGFCLYIRRAVLDTVGLFDAEHFPVGYGEEADFCYRARSVGWRHVVTGDVFVRHWEGQSFGTRKARLMAQMTNVFGRLHPDINANDRDFAARDPVRPLREALDLTRLTRMLGGAATLACLDAARAVSAEAPALAFDGMARTACLIVPGAPTLANLPGFSLPEDVAKLNAILSQLGIHCLSFEAPTLRDRFEALLRGLPMELGLKATLKLVGDAQQTWRGGMQGG